MLHDKILEIWLLACTLRLYLRLYGVSALMICDQEPRISLVAAFVNGDPQARGQSSQVSSRSPDVDMSL
jgi:hypothetical protein